MMIVIKLLMFWAAGLALGTLRSDGHRLPGGCTLEGHGWKPPEKHFKFIGTIHDSPFLILF